VLSRRLLARENGFLLVDLLTASVLVSIMFALFSSLLVSVVSRNGTINSQADLSTEARSALDTMGDELASAVCNGSTAPVTAASGTGITFYAPDRQQSYHLLQLTYSLAGHTLTRQRTASTNTGGPPWTMGSTPAAALDVESVVNSTVFHYYDSSGADLAPGGGTVPAASLPSIARVTMTLTMTPPTSHGAGSLTAQASATLRTPQCD
jgi:type II secretory pathway component PulJ